MAIKTYTEQLIEVQAAISKIITGAQSYGEMGRNLTYADLPTLLEQEKYLRIMADREENSNGKIGLIHGVIG